jgi:hypothetical protein
MLIKVYGEFWSRQRVDWSKKQLAGVRKGKPACNLWEERGIDRALICRILEMLCVRRWLDVGS